MTTYNNREYVAFANITADTAAFTLRGGRYAVEAVATWGGGSATLKRLSNDGTTYVAVLTAITANQFVITDLPSGTYLWAVATATGVYLEIESIAVPIF